MIRKVKKNCILFIIQTRILLPMIVSQDFEVDVSCRVVEIKRVIMDAFDLEGIDEYGLCFGLKDRGSSLFKPSVCSCFYFLPRLASKYQLCLKFCNSLRKQNYFT